MLQTAPGSEITRSIVVVENWLEKLKRLAPATEQLPPFDAETRHKRMRALVLGVKWLASL